MLKTQDSENRKQYANKELTRAISNAKNYNWNKRCSEVESDIRRTRRREEWKLIRNMKQNNQNMTNIQLTQMKDLRRPYEKMLNEDRNEFDKVK